MFIIDAYKDITGKGQITNVSGETITVEYEDDNNTLIIYYKSSSYLILDVEKTRKNKIKNIISEL